MATLHIKYPSFLFFFFFLESICQAAKKHHKEAKATGMRVI